MNLKSLLIASLFVGASSLGASAATLNPADYTINGQVQGGNCPFGVGPCIVLANNGPNSTAQLTFNSGTFDLTSFTYSLQGTGSQVTATSNLGDIFVSVPLQGNNTDNTAIVNWTGITTINFDNTGNGTVRIGGFETPMTAVPLPAGLPLMLAGLGALGIAKRRKKA